MTLNELSKAAGVPLKVRDTHQLLIDTELHLKEQEERKLKARAKSVETKRISEEDAINEFYKRGNHVD